MSAENQTQRILSSSIRVLIADKRSVMRYGYAICSAAVEEVAVVGDAVDSESLQAAARLLRPDVILIGMTVLASTWLDAAQWENGGHAVPLVAAMPEIRDAYLAVAAWAGAQGYVVEDASPSELAGALCRAAAGQSGWRSDDRQRALRWQEDVGQPWCSLTVREREVFHLLVRGMSNSAIGSALVLAPKTVEHHVSSILGKLGLASRAMAASWYYHQFPALLREK